MKQRWRKGVICVEAGAVKAGYQKEAGKSRKDSPASFVCRYGILSFPNKLFLENELN